MIRMMTGHLGMGDWKLVTQDGTLFLHHRLPFSPRSEYRIGCDQILDVQVLEINGDQRVVDISLTEERQCTAQLPESELASLLAMVNSQEPAPEPTKSMSLWVYTFIGFFILSLLFEFLEHLL